MIEISDVKLDEQYTVRLAVTSDERVPAEYRSGEFQPERIVLGWERGTDQSTWRLRTATVHGLMLKRDGTPSLVFGKHGFTRGDGGLSLDTPAWLVQLVNLYAPKGA